MDFNTLQTIYYLLKNEVEKKQNAYKMARDEWKEAKEDEDSKDHISCLETIKENLYQEYNDAKHAFDVFIAKDWN